MTRYPRRLSASLLKWRFFPALMIVLALTVGMLLPSAVLAAQSSHLEKSDTLLSTGISVSRQSSETAKLDVLCRFFNTIANGEGEELELSRGRYMTAEQAMEHISELKTIADSAELHFEAPPAYAESFAVPVLVVLSDNSGMTSSIVWIIQYMWDKNELSFAVDDETGIILSAHSYFYDYDISINDQPQPISGDVTARAQQFADALCRSYGFETVTAEAETVAVETEFGSAEADNADSLYAVCDIQFILDSKPQCSVSLSFEGQNWDFGV